MLLERSLLPLVNPATERRVTWRLEFAGALVDVEDYDKLTLTYCCVTLESEEVLRFQN